MKQFQDMSLPELEDEWEMWSARIRKRRAIDSVTCAMVDVRAQAEEWIDIRRQQLVGAE